MATKTHGLLARAIMVVAVAGHGTGQSLGYRAVLVFAGVLAGGAAFIPALFQYFGGLG